MNTIYDKHNMIHQKNTHNVYKTFKKYPLMITNERLINQLKKTNSDIKETYFDGVKLDYGMIIHVDDTFNYDVSYNKCNLNKSDEKQFKFDKNSDGVFGFSVDDATYAIFNYTDEYNDFKINMKEYENTGTFILLDFTYDTPLFIFPCTSQNITITTDGNNVSCFVLWIELSKRKQCSVPFY